MPYWLPVHEKRYVIMAPDKGRPWDASLSSNSRRSLTEQARQVIYDCPVKYGLFCNLLFMFYLQAKQVDT